MLTPLLATACGFVLAVVLMIAGWHKLRNATEYAARFDAYALLPVGAGRLLAFPLGLLELLSGLLVAIPSSRPAAAVAVLALLGLYSLAILINLLRGRGDIDCGCAGPRHQQPLSLWLPLRNLVLMGAAAYAFLATATAPRGIWQWLAALLIAAGGLLLYNGVNFVLGRDSLLTDD